MKTLLISTLLLLMVPQISLAETISDREAILTALETWKQGRAQHDAELAVQHYAEDTDWANAFGDRFQGKGELRGDLVFIFNLDFVMSDQSGEPEYIDIRFINEFVAIVRSRSIR